MCAKPNNDKSNNHDNFSHISHMPALRLPVAPAFPGPVPKPKTTFRGFKGDTEKMCSKYMEKG